MIRPASIGALAVPEPLSLSIVRAIAVNPVGTIIKRTTEIADRRPLALGLSPLLDYSDQFILDFFDYTYPAL